MTRPHQQPDLAPPKADFSAPPPYESCENISAGKLPTYEEVQMEKILNEELPSQPPLMPPPPPGINDIPGMVRQSPAPYNSGLTFIAIDPESDTVPTENSLLGTDLMFVTAFLIAFLFNWVGFLVLTCFCHTVAARYGALSGFGLSLAKWTLIVKNSTDFAHENSWLWWLIMAFGFLICIRAFVQYISIKRTWRLLSASAQERLLFFY